jgi:methionine biosynthesis protein MetW
MEKKQVRIDHQVIAGVIRKTSSVLDLGCGTGDLLDLLAKEKSARGQGIEIDEQAIYACVAKGLSVFHGDVDSGLAEYQDKSFDYVILNQSMQEVTKVDFIIQEALRVGEKVIVGFPNFAYINARLRLFFRGGAPMTKALPHLWYETPNVRSLSINDFKEYCRAKKVRVLKAYYLREKKRIWFWPNLLALNAVFLLTR